MIVDYKYVLTGLVDNCRLCYVVAALFWAKFFTASAKIVGCAVKGICKSGMRLSRFVAYFAVKSLDKNKICQGKLTPTVIIVSLCYVFKFLQFYQIRRNKSNNCRVHLSIVFIGYPNENLVATAKVKNKKIIGEAGQ